VNTIKYFFFVFLFLFSAREPVAEGDLIIDIDSGVENRLPIAIIPFGWSGTPDTR